MLWHLEVGEIMELTKNKAKYVDAKGTVQQEVTYSDPYQEVREKLVRRGNQAVVTEVEHKAKK